MTTVPSRDSFVVSDKQGYQSIVSWGRHQTVRKVEAGLSEAGRDGCVVPTAPLAELLGSFVDDWNQRHPQAAGQFSHRRQRDTAERRVEIGMVGAIEWIATASGVSAGTIKNIVQARHQHTELGIADAICMALDRPEVMRDGTLEVMPNPHARREAREACCSGSQPAEDLVGA